LKIIISGGGTGGHIFPALSIAKALKIRYPNVEILFVGAENRMEMEKVPAAGYRIIGLPVAGFDRKNPLKNIAVLWKLYKSMAMARKIIKDFQPDMVIGVGGYASGPVMKAAAQRAIPTLLQEQNSYAGVTNKLLAKKAAKICVAYEGMERFFPKKKIVLTGNPTRQDLVITDEKRREAYQFSGLDTDKKTLLVLGGSLGARTLNESILAHLSEIADSDVQVLWQTGKYYYKDILALPPLPYQIYPLEFISRMDLAYSIADLVISRAGAGSISEFCLLGKPVILTPSPNVAEDHQTKNALALVERDAALMVKDSATIAMLVHKALLLLHNQDKCQILSDNISKLARPNEPHDIAQEVMKMVKNKE